MVEVVSALLKILDRCQKSNSTHRASLKEIRILQKKHFSKFKSAFSDEINRLLVISKNEPAVERLVDFIVSMTVPLVEEDEKTIRIIQEFTDFLLKYLIHLSSVTDKTVRFRCVQLICKITGTLSSFPEAALEDGLEEEILKQMEIRSSDKSSLVRIWALRTLCPFADPTDPSDGILSVIQQSLEQDPSKLVRKSILSRLGISKYTIHDIVRRTRDIEWEVRKKAFLVIAERCPIISKPNIDNRSLLQSSIGSQTVTATQDVISTKNSISEWIDEEMLNQLFVQGLGDYHPDVQQAALSLLLAWLDQIALAFDQQEVTYLTIFKFLSFFDFQNHQSTFETILKSILSQSTHSLSIKFHNKQRSILIDLQQLKEEDISSEFAFFWRIYCEYIRKNTSWHECESIFDIILPETTKMCILLRHYWSKNGFIVYQLLHLCLLLDKADEAGKKMLSSFLCAQIGSLTSKKSDDVMDIDGTPVSVILQQRIDSDDESDQSGFQLDEKGIVALLQVLLVMDDDEQSFVRRMIEVISDLKDPLEPDLTSSQAERDEKSFPATLTITEFLLQSTQLNLNDPGIDGLLDDVILPSIKNSNPENRRRALKCLSLYCLFDVNVARSHLPIFLNAVQHEKPNVAVVAALALFDFVGYFGLEPLGDTNSLSQDKATQETNYEQLRLKRKEKRKSAAAHIAEHQNEISIVKELRKLITTNSDVIRLAVIEGFCKLLYSDVLTDSRILSLLVIEMFNPIISHPKFCQIKPCLKAFFELYVNDSNHRRSLEEALMAALSRLLRAQGGSPFSKIKIKDLISFFLPLLDSDRDVKDSESVVDSIDGVSLGTFVLAHVRIAVKLLQMISLNPTGRAGTELSPILNQLRIKDPRFSEEKPISEDKETEESYISLIQQARHSLSNSLSVITDKSTISHLQKFEKMLLSIDSSPIKKSVKESFGSGIPKSIPIERKIARTPSELLEERRLHFEEIDKFQLAEDKPKPTPPSSTQLKREIQKERDELNELFASAQKKAKNEGEEDKEEDVTVILQKLKEKMDGILKKEETLQQLTTRKKRKPLNFPAASLKPPAINFDPNSDDNEPKRKKSSKRKLSEIDDVNPSKSSKNFFIDSPFQRHDKKNDEKEDQESTSKTPTRSSYKRASMVDSNNLYSRREREKKQALKEAKEKKKDNDKQQKQKEELKLTKEQKKEQKKVEKQKKQEEAEQKKAESERKKLEKQQKKLNKSETIKKRKHEEEGEEEEDANKRRKLTSSVEVKLIKTGKKNKSVLFKRNESKENVQQTEIKEQDTKEEVKDKKKGKYVISFSGFNELDKTFDFNFRLDLAKKVRTLLGKVEISENFSPTITHVVAPPNCRTMKTLVASLTSRWIVSPQWLIDSEKAGMFLPEADYGFKGKSKPFKGQKVFISDDFRKENEGGNFHFDNYSLLIEKLGGGELTPAAFSANVILVARTGNQFENLSSSVQRLNYQQFFNLIQPVVKDE